MYWDKETQSVIARSGRKQEIIQYSFFDLGKCISNPGLPPIPNTNALLSYLEPCYTDDPNNAAQIFYMVKRKFRYLLYISESAYNCFTIKKSNGKDRKICSPNGTIRHYQRWVKENILEELPLPDCAYAYRKGYSMRDCAEKHHNKPVVMRLDIKDFFETVSVDQICNVFYKMCRYEDSVGLLLAEICMMDWKLPQGAITSPIMSNLVFAWYDEHIMRFCDARDITYTRYSDDMYFSGDFIPGEVTKYVRNLIGRGGFHINKQKTKVMPFYRRQSVLGLTVNEDIYVSREYRRRLRQELYYIKKHGVKAHILAIGAEEYIKDGHVQRTRYLRHLLGQINYVLSIHKTKTWEKEREYLLRCLRGDVIVGRYTPEEVRNKHFREFR